MSLQWTRLQIFTSPWRLAGLHRLIASEGQNTASWWQGRGGLLGIGNHAVVPWLSLPTPPPLSTTARPHYDKAHDITRAGPQGRNYEGRGWAQCPSLIIGVLFLQNYVYCNLLHNVWRHNDATRGSILVAPDTTSDVARRGELLVLENEPRFRGQLLLANTITTSTLENEHTCSFSRAAYHLYHTSTLENEHTRSFSRVFNYLKCV